MGIKAWFNGSNSRRELKRINPLVEKVFDLESKYQKFTDDELIRWLTSYCKRLFSQQFKRSCLMDGPAVEAFTVSPRVGFLIPSDAEATLFLKDIDQIAAGRDDS